MSQTSQAPAPGAGVVIIGSGLGGYTLAREWRKLDSATPLTIITADGGEAYSKPMLSNAFAQQKPPARLAQKTAEQQASELNATILTRTSVQSIDRAGKQVILADGRPLPWRTLVLAIGAAARPYSVPVSDQPSPPIHSVNSLDDYSRWHQALGDTAGKRILLVGAGLIGCEFANDLALAGCAVTIVDPAPWPLGRLLPEESGAVVATALRDAGITLHLGRSLARLDGNIAILDDGSKVPFDHALSAIGLISHTRLASEAGLTVERGIVTNSLLQTSDPDIYALGDCAQTPAGLLPFVLPLMAQAKALAKTLAGTGTPLVLPALPVVVKTPCLPVVVCPPPVGSNGSWQTSGEGSNLKSLFVTPGGATVGFALTGSQCNERQTLARQMPDILPAA